VMAGKNQPYPEYKEINMDWVERVPIGWERSALGFECSVKARLGWRGLKAEEYVDEGFVFLSTPNIKSKYIDFVNVDRITKDRYEESSEIMLEVGDVLVTKDGSTTGTTNLVRELPEPATVNSSIAIIRSLGNLKPEFLYYFIQSNYTQSVIDRMRGGMGVPHLFQADLRKFNVLMPCLSEQIVVAEFLDYETAKIDTLIEKQQQLIELLEEKRQAVISHAVTKGLNPDAPMKPSGVLWLGDVPAHWKVAKLSYRYEVLLGKMLDEKKITGSYLCEYLRNTDVQWGYINEDDLPVMDFRPEERERYSVKPGDLLVCEGGEIGRCALWSRRKRVFYQKALHRLRPQDPTQDDASYMYFVLCDAVHQDRFLGGAGKATIAHLPAETFKQYRFAFPALAEQKKIAIYLNQVLSKFDRVKTAASEQIALLQERRTALISAAVTGKIDVRNWRPPESGEIRAEVVE